MSDQYLVGTEQDDSLVGGQGNDTLIGLGGSDTLAGGAGNDFLDAGAGGDTYLFGRGDGQDMIVSESASASGLTDRLKFGIGISMADVDVTKENSDLVLRLIGSNDSVRIMGYFNASTQSRMQIVFADGSSWDGTVIDRKLILINDYFSGTSLDDVFDGGLGNDSLFGMGGNDTLYGDVGNDFLDGGAGTDTYLFGRGDGQDTIVAGAGLVPSPGIPDQDKLQFGVGISMADVVVTRASNDLILALIGSSDSVRISGYFSAPPLGRMQITFADGSNWDNAAIDRKLSVSNDYITSPPSTSTLDGGLGNDSLYGADSNDILYGDGGDDFMDGARGNDTYLFGRGDGQDTIMAGTGASSNPYPSIPDQDKLQFGAGITMADVAVTKASNDLILGLIGSNESVRIVGYFNNFNGLSQTRMRIAFSDGSNWDSAAIDRKLFPSNDYITSQPNATLDGGLGNDSLYGASSNDILYGDGGNDFMDGAMGNDTYLFGRGDGQDTIVAGSGFIPSPGTPDKDKLQFAASISMADVTATRDYNDLVLALIGSSDSVRIAGYFNPMSQTRMQIAFADGSNWDSVAIDRKLFASSDYIMSVPGNSTLDGGLGNDTLFGSTGEDILYGDAGNDSMNGAAGNDIYLFGRGDGQDTIVAGTTGGLPPEQDKLQFGYGITMTDIAVTRENTDIVLALLGSRDSVRLSNYFNGGQNLMQIGFADGSSWDSMAINRKIMTNNDSMTGTFGDDVLDGGLGNDTLFGSEGSDTLYGDSGNDLLAGSTGRDTYLFGRGDGQDTIAGNLGFYSIPGEDKLQFGGRISLSDVAVSREGNDLLLSIVGTSDSIRITSYFNYSPQDRMPIAFIDGSTLDAMAIDRRLYASDDRVSVLPNGTLDGGLGNDSLYGEIGNETLYGGRGNDLMYGAPGSDTYLFGIGDGQDTIRGEEADWNPTPPTPNRDKLQFGYGISVADVAVTQESNDLILKLVGSADSVRIASYFTAAQQGRTQVTFSDGSSFDTTTIDRKLLASNDSLLGTAGDDLLDGGLGNDYLSGGEGSDTLYGDGGNDFMTGDLGSDTYLFGIGDGQDTVKGDLGSAPYPDTQDTLQFGNGISMADVAVTKESNDLLLALIGSSDSVRIAGYFTSSAQMRVQILFADGSGWDSTTVDRKVSTTDDYLFGTLGDDLIDGGLGNDIINGNGGNDTLYGDAGNDTLDGSSGNDSMFGGKGNDKYLVDNLNDSVVEKLDEGVDLVVVGSTYVLGANVENLVLTGSTAIDGTGNNLDNFLTGNGASNLLTGGLGNDTMDGGVGGDTLSGGVGNDVYVVDNVSDIVLENTSEGFDLVQSSINYTLGANVESLLLTNSATTGSGNDLDNLLTGNELANFLSGGSGNDTLDGGVGIDTLVGGAGDDVYIVDRPNDVVVENSISGGGVDLVRSSVTYTLSDNVENLTLTGIGEIYATGNSLNNVLIGNSSANTLRGSEGSDTLDGGAGNDVLIGGTGNDTYIVNDAGDYVLEYSDEGTDLVKSSITYQIRENLENLILTGISSINGFGNLLDNMLSGNSGDNVLDGNSGVDTMVGGDGNDTYIVDNERDLVIEQEGAGRDLVKSSVRYTLGSNSEDLILVGSASISASGNNLANRLTGNAAANSLDGRAGADTMMGGDGNDDYFVDNDGDVVIENLNEGTDLVQASVTYTLSNNVENLVLMGNAAIDGIGNILNNVLTGNTAANMLLGGAGLDTLDGGAGIDTLIGGTGNDTYIIDDVGDLIVENVGGGTDVVKASITYQLVDNVETLLLTGTAAINGTGNALNNALAGNSNDNVLDGGTGVDTMIGGAGNDVYIVDIAGDLVVEQLGSGTDLVQANVSYALGSNVENLLLVGTDSINATGNTLANKLTGNAGANRLDGRSGADTMFGGGGDDVYIVDNIGDLVIENEFEGVDTVSSTVSYTLGDNLENLDLNGDDDIGGTGNALDNLLNGNAGNNVLDGGAGSDTLMGGIGNDTYVFGRGYSTETISEDDSTIDNMDALQAANDVYADQLWFIQNGNDLEVSIIGTADSTIIANWYLGDQYHVEQFKSGDGKMLLDSQVQNLVSAMAAFAPPAAGETTLPTDYQTALAPVLAANWQ